MNSNIIDDDTTVETDKSSVESYYDCVMMFIDSHKVSSVPYISGKVTFKNKLLCG